MSHNITTLNTEVPAKRKKRVFLWFFLAIQAIFIAWIIGGIASAGSSAAANCGTLSAQTCSDAAALGTGIGVMLIVGLWLATDFIVGMVYGIYRLSTRNR
jgi:uncharacterized membrane protein